VGLFLGSTESIAVSNRDKRGSFTSPRPRSESPLVYASMRVRAVRTSEVPTRGGLRVCGCAGVRVCGVGEGRAEGYRDEGIKG
jgi:fructose-1,6-bisphosphatase/inositol monophosphatase family enzyme